jgi:hypothetical protein
MKSYERGMFDPAGPGWAEAERLPRSGADDAFEDDQQPERLGEEDIDTVSS